MKLQEQFDKWILDNKLKSDIKFDPTEVKAFQDNKAISIYKDDKKLVLKSVNNNLHVSLHQDLEQAKKNIDTISFNKLLEGNTVSKLTQSYGEIKELKENTVILNNNFGEFEIPKEKIGFDFKEGDKVEVDLKVNTVTLNDEKIVLDQYDFKPLTSENPKHTVSIFELDKQNLTIVESNPQALLENIKSINSIELTQEQKNKLLKGEEVDLDDNLKVKFSPMELFKANQKNVLIASVLLDGGMSYMLLKGVEYLMKKTPQENIQDLEKIVKDGKNLIPEEIQNELNKEIAKEKIRTTDVQELTLEINGEKMVVSQEDLFNTVNEKIEEKNLKSVDVKIHNDNNIELTALRIDSQDLILKDAKLFDHYLNTKNQLLFKDEQKNKSIEELSLLVKQTDTLLIKSKLSEKEKIETQNNFQNYLNSIRSILLQKSRAYPENKDIIKDINILSKNISLISRTNKQTVQQHKKATAVGTNDPDMLQRAREEKEKKIKTTDDIFHPKSQNKRGRRL